MARGVVEPGGEVDDLVDLVRHVRAGRVARPLTTVRGGRGHRARQRGAARAGRFRDERSAAAARAGSRCASHSDRSVAARSAARVATIGSTRRSRASASAAAPRALIVGVPQRRRTVSRCSVIVTMSRSNSRRRSRVIETGLGVGLDRPGVAQLPEDVLEWTQPRVPICVAGGQVSGVGGAEVGTVSGEDRYPLLAGVVDRRRRPGGRCWNSGRGSCRRRRTPRLCARQRQGALRWPFRPVRRARCWRSRARHARARSRRAGRARRGRP